MSDFGLSIGTFLFSGVPESPLDTECVQYEKSVEDAFSCADDENSLPSARNDPGTLRLLALSSGFAT